MIDLEANTYCIGKGKLPIRVVAIGDLHSGSMFSVADPSRSPTHDAAYPMRKILFEKYKAATKNKQWKNPDVLIVGGDCVDGQNRKKSGIGTWTSDLLEQADHAEHLIRMWGAEKVIMIRGSGYHVDAANSGLQIEELIARKIKAVPAVNQPLNVDEDNRIRSEFDWYININGYTIHASHKIAVSKVFHYQSTPTARQMLQARLNDALRHEIADVDLRIKCVMRWHAHYFNTVGYSGTDGFVLPCWKGLDEFMRANGPIDISPDLGFVGFEITPNGRMSYEKNLFNITEAQSPNLVLFRRGR